MKRRLKEQLSILEQFEKVQVSYAKDIIRSLKEESSTYKELDQKLRTLKKHYSFNNDSVINSKAVFKIIDDLIREEKDSLSIVIDK